MDNSSNEPNSVRPRGLIGGSPDMRARHGSRAPIHHPLFLDPIHEAAEGEALRAFTDGSPLAVEIGFGRGWFLAHFARTHPEWRIAGFEVKKKLCVEALERLDKLEVSNARIILGDARSLMQQHVRPGSVSALFILFPDPWWKKKHHKRRVLDGAFLTSLRPLLAPDCLLVVRSDVPMVLDLARTAAGEAGFVPGTADTLTLPQTDRERVCDQIGIPYDEARFHLAPEVTDAG